MNVYEILTLRLIHIFSGVFWAGSTIYLAAFVMPAINALGAEGGKFMQQLSRTNKLPLWMNIAALLNVITGFRLLQIMSGNFQSEWLMSNHGLAISFGSLMALGGFIIGLVSTRPAAMKMAKISEDLAKAGGPPSAEQAKELESLKNKMGRTTKAIAWHLATAVVMMSVARYI